jgi:hypothetical protein
MTYGGHDENQSDGLPRYRWALIPSSLMVGGTLVSLPALAGGFGFDASEVQAVTETRRS